MKVISITCQGQKIRVISISLSPASIESSFMSNSSKHFSIEALVDLQQPSEARISPDGKTVAFVQGKSNKPDQYSAPEKSIYLIDIASGKTVQLSASNTGTNDQPCWSPDGHHLAFISNCTNPDEMQVYLIDIRDGEAQALTNLRGCVHSLQWSPDGSSINFLYNGNLNPEKQADPDPICVDENPAFNRVWSVNIHTGELKAITSDSYHVFEYVFSPDDNKLAVLIASHPNPAEGWYSAQVHSLDLASGLMQQVCTMTHQIGRLTWSPDSTQIAFVCGVMSDEGNISGEVYCVDASGGIADCLTPELDHSITWIDWREEGILYGARQIESCILGWIDPQNKTQHIFSKGEYSINGIGPQYVDVAQNNSFVAIRESFDEAPSIYLGSLNHDKWQKISHLPIDEASFPPLRVENRYWYGDDGLPVYGFLIYPCNYQAGKRYPLFAHVHGGPSWSYVPRYVNQWGRILTARDCFVLMPNPRGSWGRGHAYQSANVGDLGGGDWRDIQAGIDCLINSGLIDPERLAIGGWSYGGFLVTWAITQTDRFRCAIAGASITNYESNYGLVSNREWQTTMFGSNVYEDTELHRSRSPLSYVNRVKTPTLLVHGLADQFAPSEQAIEFYTALKHFGVPTKLVLYPREPHGFIERAHQVDLLQRIEGWIDQYLFD